MIRRLLPVAAVIWSSAAHASPLELFGFGGRSPALGATGVAAADDFDCTYLNPAGLADVQRRRISLGTLVGDFELSGTGVDRTVDDATGIEIGGALPIPLGGALEHRVGLGIGLYIPTQAINVARAPRPGAPFFALLEDRSQVVGVQIAAGVRLTPKLSVGAGFLALAALRGKVDIAPDASGRFASTSEEQLVSRFSPILGVRWRPRGDDSLVFGATFRYESKSTYDLSINADLGNALPVALPQLRVAGTAQFDPTTLAAEVAWRPRAHPSLLLLGQLQWQHWSAYPLPTENPVAAMPPQEDPGFSDTVTPRVGIEWHHDSGDWELALRGGYFFFLSPAPEMTGQQALLDNHRHVFSIGVGLAAPHGTVPLHVDAWFQTHVLMSRHHDRPDPQQDIDTSGAIFVGGLMLGVDL
jgi:long-chain fatty acid transport protein